MTAADPADPATTGRQPLVRLLAGVAVAGGVGWLLDVALLYLLEQVVGTPAAVAAAVGFVASGIVNYLINRSVFGAREGESNRQRLRYLALFGLNLVVVTVAVPLLADVLDPLVTQRGVALLVAKVIVTAVMLVPNTLAYRHWVFVTPPPVPLPVPRPLGPDVTPGETAPRRAPGQPDDGAHSG